MKKLILGLLGLVLASFLRWAPAAAEPTNFRIVAHRDNPATSLERTQVSKILLKQVSRWDDGTPVAPVDQQGEGAVREAFTKQIHGRSVFSIRRYWQRQVFSGGKVPPPELDGDARVLDYVRGHPGGIGYVSADAPLDGVKELIVTD